MKKTTLISALFFLVLNLVIFLLLSGFKNHQFLASETSLLLSFVMLYLTAASKLDDAFKIFLTFSFIVTGIVKYVLCFFFELPVQDNIVFLILVIISALEILSVISVTYFTKHA